MRTSECSGSLQMMETASLAGYGNAIHVQLASFRKPASVMLLRKRDSGVRRLPVTGAVLDILRRFPSVGGGINFPEWGFRVTFHATLERSANHNSDGR